MSRKRSTSLDPHHLNQDAWYYESARGIEVVRQVRDGDGNYLATSITMVSWKKIRKSMRRCLGVHV